MFDLTAQIWTDFAGVNERKLIANQIRLGKPSFTVSRAINLTINEARRRVFCESRSKRNQNLRYRLANLTATVKFGFEQIYVRKKRVLKFINLKTVHSLGNLRLANDAGRAINQAQAGLAKTCWAEITDCLKWLRRQKTNKRRRNP